jgi:glycosyltransferase involved in cell wall biosynthesis
MKICLVGATHPCHNPRLVREADTLADAGHDVRVVAPSHSRRLAAKDVRLVATRQWRFEPIDFRLSGITGRCRAVLVRGRRRAAAVWHRGFPSRQAGELAYLLALPELKRRAAAERADWFIAHAQAALPVAASAARHWHAQLGFDCEDLLAISTSDPTDIVTAIETEYLPRCDYVSTPTAAMAAKLREMRGVALPTVLPNVFPLRLANGLVEPARRPAGHAVKLHWFSQTIGPRRGIEDAIDTIALLGAGVELHLRGSVSGEYRAALEQLAASRNVSGRLLFHEQIDHDDLIRSLGQFDIGLALERPDDPNYSLTVTNKVFSYVLAGLPVAATSTPGQLELLEGCPAISVLYPAGDSHALARALAPWVSNPAARRAAQQAAWVAARRTFSWDRISGRFLDLLSRSRAGRLQAPRLEACVGS